MQGLYNENNSKKPADALSVPAHLAAAYKAEPEPTELEVLKALQGEGLKDYGMKMFHTLWPTRGMVDERQALEQTKSPDFERYVKHRIKLERVAMRLSQELEAARRIENKAQRDWMNTCPVCGEVSLDNNRQYPCKRCVVVIRQKLAQSKSREAAVDKWLKSNEYKWVG